MSRKLFYKIYWKLESILVPGLKYSQTIYEEVLNEHCEKKNKWLDLGCGRQLLSRWRFGHEKVLIDKVKTVFGIDYDYLSLTKHKTIKNVLRGNIAKLPFPDNTFDLITSNMVFEHLDNPEKQLKEITRVLSQGGKLIFHTPNTFGYGTFLARLIPEFIKTRLIYILQGREDEDVFPAYYRINSPSKIREIAFACGLKVSRIKLICSSALLVVFPPIVLFELFWIRFLMSKVGKPLRTNIIVILNKA